MPSPLSTDAFAGRRLRRRAIRRTTTVVLSWLYVAACLVKAYLGQDARGAWVFLWWAVSTPPLALLIRSWWRQAHAARAVWLPDEAGPGALAGVPEIDEPAGPHLALNGQDPPPRRW